MKLLFNKFDLCEQEEKNSADDGKCAPLWRPARVAPQPNEPYSLLGGNASNC